MRIYSNPVRSTLSNKWPTAACRTCVYALHAELTRLIEVQHAFRTLSYFDITGRSRLTIQLTRIALSLPLALERALVAQAAGTADGDKAGPAQTCDAADTGRGRRSGAHGAHTQIARGGSVASHARTFVTESISRGTHRRRGSRLQAASGCIPQTPKTSPTATLRPRSPHARCACAHACDTPYPAVYDPQTDSRASPTPRPMPISSSQIIP